MKTIYVLTARAMQCHDQSQMRTGNHRNQIGFYWSGNDFLWSCMQAKQNKEAGIPHTVQYSCIEFQFPVDLLFDKKQLILVIFEAMNSLYFYHSFTCSIE